MLPLWIITGLIVVVSLVGFNTFQKALVSDYGALDVAYYTNFIAAGILLPVAAYYFNVGDFPIQSGLFLIASGIFNAVSFYFLPLALAKEDLGVISQTRGITPIMLAFIEPLIFLDLDYDPVLIVAGFLAGLGLYISFSEDGLLTPIKKISSTGVQLGLISAVVIIFAVLVDRFAVTEVGASPQMYAFGLAGTTALFLSLMRYKNPLDRLFDVEIEDTSTVVPPREFIPVGIFRASAIGFAIYTLSITTGTEYNILVQLSIPLSVLSAYIFLGEDKFTIRRVIGAMIIVTAIYLLVGV